MNESYNAYQFRKRKRNSVKNQVVRKWNRKKEKKMKSLSTEHIQHKKKKKIWPMSSAALMFIWDLIFKLDEREAEMWQPLLLLLLAIAVKRQVHSFWSINRTIPMKTRTGSDAV